MATTFKLKKHMDDTLDNLYSKAINELIEFYKFNWIKNRPKVYVLDTREDINSAYGRETQDWLVGWSDGRSLYLLSRETFEKESKHKYSEEVYFKLIKHELSHLFFRVITGSDKPTWLNEGIATLISGQLGDTTDIENFEVFLEDPKEVGSALYKESGYAVKVLIENFGEDALRTFIKKIKGYKTTGELKSLFKEVFGIPLKYASFNSLLE